MTAEGPHAGLTNSRFLIVDPSVIVPALTPAHRLAADAGDGVHGGFRRGHLHRCPEAFSREGRRTVGTHVDLSHVAATPVRIRVTAQVKLVTVEDRKLRFKVECRDEKEIIGTGFHYCASIRPGP
jgi:fluoroacetyl-CoA thioesterase